MSSTIYPCHGGLEDWAYAAGWDYNSNATEKRCSPITYPLWEDGITVSLDEQKSVKSLMFLVEADFNKQPLSWTLGSSVRHLNKTTGETIIDGIYTYRKVLN